MYLLIPISPTEHFTAKFEIESILLDNPNPFKDVFSVTKSLDFRNISFKIGNPMVVDRLISAIDWEDVKFEEAIMSPFSLSSEILFKSSSESENFADRVQVSIHLDKVEINFSSRSVDMLLKALRYYKSETTRLELQRIKENLRKEFQSTPNPVLLWKFAFWAVVFLRFGKFPEKMRHVLGLQKMKNEYAEIYFRSLLYLLKEFYSACPRESSDIYKTRTEFFISRKTLSDSETILPSTDILILQRRAHLKLIKFGISKELLSDVVLNETFLLWVLKYFWITPKLWQLCKIISLNSFLSF